MADGGDGAAGRYVGQRISRKEDVRLLTGRGRYVDDMAMPGMLHAAFLRSPHARARILRIDAQAARALPGVHGVFTGADLNGEITTLRGATFPEPLPFPNVYPLAGADARFAGDLVAIVVADDRYIAEDATELIEVDYAVDTPVLDYLKAESGPLVHPELGTNLVMSGGGAPSAELEAIFAAAPHVVEHTLRQQRYVNVPMETRGLIAQVSFEGDVTIWSATQAPHRSARHVGHVLGIGDDRVRVISNDVGGGFGMKTQPGRDEIAVVLAARKLGRPVKWIEDRWENLIGAAHAREESATVRLAFDSEYRILAAYFDYIGNSGAYPWLPTLGGMAADTFPGPYRIAKYGFRFRSYYTNTCGLGAYRGPWMFETVARETAIDAAARELGIEPLELRRRNVIRPADQPYTSATGRIFDRVSPDQTLEKVAGLADLARFRAEQADARKAGRYLGLGFGLCMEPTVHATGERSSTVAEVRVDTSGLVTVMSATHSAGNSTETTLAQIAAEHLGVDIRNVRVIQGDSSRTAFGSAAAGSGQAVMGGGAVHVAAGELRTKILTIASHLLEAPVDDLVARDGVISVAGTDKSITLRKIAETAYLAPAGLPPGMPLGLEARHRYAPPPVVWANASHACIVEVDPETGLVRILRWMASADCGVMINPAVVEGQIAGGVVQGIGGVLLEHAAYDGQGNPIAVTFKDYLLPLATQIPLIEFDHVCTPSETRGGFKGAGEGGAIIAPPTLINAVLDALAPFNPVCADLPLSPERVLSLIEKAKAPIIS